MHHIISRNVCQAKGLPGRQNRFGDAVAVKSGVLGGASLSAQRPIWWNFVSSSKERIEQAKADWAAQRMGKVVGDEEEYIPLPA